MNHSNKTFVGLDAGHNNLKLVLQEEGEEIISKAITPSYILTNEELFSSSSALTPGLVKYLEGTRGDLINKCWLMGANAIQANEKASIPLASAQDGMGKVEFSLHSLLSLLSTLPYKEKWNLFVACSNHRADVYDVLLKEKMNGRHKVMLSGKQSEVLIKVVEVVDEATHYQPKVGNEVVLLDFGGGTTIYVKYSKEGINVDRQVVEVGVDDLISLLYDDPTLYALLHKDRSRHLLRQGLESSKDGEVIYGIKDRGGVDITAPYLKCLKTWISAYMKDIFVQTQKSLRSGAILQLIGGGSMLPKLEESLTQILTKGGKEKHIINKVSKNALWTNSLALLELAKNYKNLEMEGNGKVKSGNQDLASLKRELLQVSGGLNEEGN